MRKRWQAFLTADEAATAVEYAVMLALVIVVCLVGIGTLGVQNGNRWSTMNNQLSSAGLGASAS